ncbi:MAG: hypothetical protein LBQ24_00590 [Candidatus Peribacteria bacterium]|jgi:hypothetical protein|nr:hypothetical protein [Candidatus Peribacteria bacterium]
MNKTRKIFFALGILLLFIVVCITAINLYVLSFSKENYYTNIETLVSKEV